MDADRACLLYTSLKRAWEWADAAGLIYGRSENTIAPQGTATRAEIATILMRFLESVAPGGAQ